MASTQQEISKTYHRRFIRTADYRNNVWKVLTREVFNRWVASDDAVVDLGCGYGESINNISARDKPAMGLNPDTPARLSEGVRFLHQDCSVPWPLTDNSLDIAFPWLWRIFGKQFPVIAHKPSV